MWRYRLARWLGLKELATLYDRSQCTQCGLKVDPHNRYVVEGQREPGLFAFLFDDGHIATLHAACFPSWIRKCARKGERGTQAHIM
jgi:hypothetical protein